MRRQPWLRVFPGDWRSDVALQSCSLVARGLWWEMKLIMHDCVPYGHLLVAGQPMSIATLARHLGEDPAVIAQLLSELERAGVFSKKNDGTIYSKEMIGDAKRAAVNSKNGAKGGRPPSSEKPDLLNSVSDDSHESPSEPQAPSRARARAGPGPDDGPGHGSGPRQESEPSSTAFEFTDDDLPADPCSPGRRKRVPSRLALFWEVEWRARRGIPWVWVKRGKTCPDAVALNQCLHQANGVHAEVESRMRRLLDTTDPFESKNASPSWLLKRWNFFAVDSPAAHGRGSKPDPLDELIRRSGGVRP